MLVEPLETRPEVGAAPALDDDLAGQVVGGVFGGVLHLGVDLEDDDALGPDLVGDFSDTSDQKEASASVSTEPEVSTMTAIASMPSERIEGR